ncbi:hypothetical protein OOJ91_12845 [Micromonospora lupini]|uniref:hypothetical protein n=1 Tax=Micromonospora lupini TaxID=285679 RepID=UPI002259482E|nr:hypothetical protein [Micromonospora lupini]MCX5066734.1 hypothetical protein [Micromonospora lupini]
MTSNEEAREPIAVPRQAIAGLPQWADLLPTNADLIATLGALDAIRAAHLDAVTRRNAAEEDPNYRSIPEFVSPVALGAVDPDSAEWDAAMDAVLDASRDYYLSLSDAQRAAQQAHQDAAGLAIDLNKMIVFAQSHQVIDGVAVFVQHSNTGMESIGIGSNATDVRRYVEAEKRGGRWRVQLGDLDTPGRFIDDCSTLSAVDADEVMRVGLAHILEPLRLASTGGR